MILIEQLIARAKEETNYGNVSRIIKIIKQLFNTPQEDETDAQKGKEGAPQPKKDSLATALNSQEYKAIFDFFVMDVADLVLKVAGVKKAKFDLFEKKYKETKPGSEKPHLDLKAIYAGISTKNSMLMKTFAANFNKLLKQMISQTNKGKGSESTYF